MAGKYGLIRKYSRRNFFWNGHDHRYPGMYEPDLSVTRLGRTAPAKIRKKNAKKQRFSTFLAAASCQTAGRTASGRTSAEPAWDGQYILRNNHMVPNVQGARYARKTYKKITLFFIGPLCRPVTAGRRQVTIFDLKVSHCHFGSLSTYG